MECRNRARRCPLSRKKLDEAGELIGIEPRELEPAAGFVPAERARQAEPSQILADLGPVGSEREDAAILQLSAEKTEQPQARRIRALQIIEDDQQRRVFGRALQKCRDRVEQPEARMGRVD